jgi:hypothetical protein
MSVRSAHERENRRRRRSRVAEVGEVPLSRTRRDLEHAARADDERPGRPRVEDRELERVVRAADELLRKQAAVAPSFGVRGGLPHLAQRVDPPGESRERGEHDCGEHDEEHEPPHQKRK